MLTLQAKIRRNALLRVRSYDTTNRKDQSLLGGKESVTLVIC